MGQRPDPLISCGPACFLLGRQPFLPRDFLLPGYFFFRRSFPIPWNPFFPSTAIQIQGFTYLLCQLAKGILLENASQTAGIHRHLVGLRYPQSG